MLTQSQPYGCGLYAVANALNLKDFVTDERLEKSKTGNTIGQLSKWIQEDEMPWFIETLYYDHYGVHLPDSALDYHPVGENLNYLPILMCVRYSEGGKNHMVAGKIGKDKKLYLYDSLQAEEVETTLAEVNYMFHNVYGLYCFSALEEVGYVFF